MFECYCRPCRGFKNHNGIGGKRTWIEETTTITTFLTLETCAGTTAVHENGQKTTIADFALECITLINELTASKNHGKYEIELGDEQNRLIKMAMEGEAARLIWRCGGDSAFGSKINRACLLHAVFNPTHTTLFCDDVFWLIMCFAVMPVVDR